MDGEHDYIWPTRWPEFQHYKPERDRAPAWLKDYTKQLDDSRYLDLSMFCRGLLHDLRMAFARAHGELPMNTRQLSNRLGDRVTMTHLRLLNHAGFIEFISRATLERRLEELYSSPRVRVEGEEEKEVEIPLTPQSGDFQSNNDKPLTPRAAGTNPRAQGTNPRAIAQQDKDQRHAELVARATEIADTWEGTDSAEFDERIDRLELVLEARLSFAERDDLWEKAFSVGF